MSRREELSRQAARLFAEKGYHGTSIGDLADSMGVQKGSLYAHIEGKEDLLYETMRGGAAAFHGALAALPDDAPPAEKVRLALRAHLGVVADQLDVATVFVQEWRYLEGERLEGVVAGRRRYGGGIAGGLRPAGGPRRESASRPAAATSAASASSSARGVTSETSARTST